MASYVLLGVNLYSPGAYFPALALAFQSVSVLISLINKQGYQYYHCEYFVDQWLSVHLAEVALLLF